MCIAHLLTFMAMMWSLQENLQFANEVVAQLPKSQQATWIMDDLLNQGRVLAWTNVIQTTAKSNPKLLAHAYFCRAEAYDDFHGMLFCDALTTMDKAVKDYSESLRIDPQNGNACFARGFLFLRLGDIKRRQENAEKRCKANGIVDHQDVGDVVERLCSNSLRWLACHCRTDYLLSPSEDSAVHNLDAAYRDFGDAIRLRADKPELYRYRAIAAILRNNLAGAIDDCTALITIRPKDGSAYELRALVHQKQGNLVAAITDFDASIRLNPQVASSHYWRGQAHARKGDLDRAIADYTQVIEDMARPVDADDIAYWRILSHQRRGELYQKRGETDLAKRDFAAAKKGNIDELLRDLETDGIF
jgi:tetratricopeptide (TPR) repeat protein